jgi:NTE family protein
MFLESMARRAFGLGGGGRTDGETALAPPQPTRPRMKVGLALGSGAARGWAHIGFLQALVENDIHVDVIAGTSIGAVAGGCFAAGKIDALEEFARSMTRGRVVGLMDVNIKGAGLIAGARLRRRLDRHLSDIAIEEAGVAFAAIATELQTGHEIWLTHGRMVDAICASYALPGVFPPVKLGGRWLMDGALVNPVPVSAARALGADVVISVNLNGDVGCKGAVIHSHGAIGEIPAPPAPDAARGLGAQMLEAASRINPFHRRESSGPSFAGVMVDAFNITQDRIARSRLAGDPPDIAITPRVGRIGLFEFQRADEAIAAGREAAERSIAEIRAVIGIDQAVAA